SLRQYAQQRGQSATSQMRLRREQFMRGAPGVEEVEHVADERPRTDARSRGVVLNDEIFPAPVRNEMRRPTIAERPAAMHDASRLFFRLDRLEVPRVVEILLQTVPMTVQLFHRPSNLHVGVKLEKILLEVADDFGELRIPRDAY